MSRVIDSTTEAHLTDPVTHWIVMAELDFSTGTVRAWSGYSDLVYGGNTFKGVGVLGQFGTASETTDTRATNSTLTLSGIPSALMSAVLTSNYQGAPGIVWLGLQDARGNILGAPIPIFAGTIDTSTIVDSGNTCSITMNLEGHMVDLQNPRERHYTNREQQELFPGDLGLEYITWLQNVPINWGTTGQGTSGAVNPYAIVQ